MRLLEHLNSFLSYPVGIQMCHLFWCKEYHDDFWGQQEQSSAEGETTGWIVLYIPRIETHSQCIFSLVNPDSIFTKKLYEVWEDRVLLKPLQGGYSLLTMWNGTCFSRAHSLCPLWHGRSWKQQPNNTRMRQYNRPRECGTKFPLCCSIRALAEEGALRTWEPTGDYVCEWSSKDKEKITVWAFFVVVFFTGKRALAEKSLHIWQGKLDCMFLNIYNALSPGV